MRYCQFDEETILLDFFSKHGFGNRLLCDIGARLDGSNSGLLIEDHGFKGTLVDMNQKHADALKSKFPQCDVFCEKANIENVNRFVPKGCDFLSIDVDGDDGWLFLNIVEKPRIVIVETTDVNGKFLSYYPAPMDKKGRAGVSELAIKDIAGMKGYRFAGKTGVNCVFVRKEYEFSFDNTQTRELINIGQERNVL